MTACPETSGCFQYPVVKFIQYYYIVKFANVKKRITFAVPSEKKLWLYRGVEQLVARRAHNPKVAGSSPVSATN